MVRAARSRHGASLSALAAAALEVSAAALGPASAPSPSSPEGPPEGAPQQQQGGSGGGGAVAGPSAALAPSGGAGRRSLLLGEVVGLLPRATLPLVSRFMPLTQPRYSPSPLITPLFRGLYSSLAVGLGRALADPEEGRTAGAVAAAAAAGGVDVEAAGRAVFDLARTMLFVQVGVGQHWCETWEY